MGFPTKNDHFWVAPFKETPRYGIAKLLFFVLLPEGFLNFDPFFGTLVKPPSKTKSWNLGFLSCQIDIIFTNWLIHSKSLQQHQKIACRQIVSKDKNLDLLLMEEILHQLRGSLSNYWQGLIHVRWCRISAMNNITCRSRKRLIHFVLWGMPVAAASGVEPWTWKGDCGGASVYIFSIQGSQKRTAIHILIYIYTHNYMHI